MQGIVGLVLGLAVVLVWSVVVALAWTYINEPGPVEAERLRVDLAAARKQAAISATTVDTLQQLIATAARR